MNVQHILSHVAVLSSLGTRVRTHLLFEPGNVNCCQINDVSLCLRKQAHVSLVGRVLLAAAARKQYSAHYLSRGRWSAALWVVVCRLSECDSFSVTEYKGHNDFVA